MKRKILSSFWIVFIYTSPLMGADSLQELKKRAFKLYQEKDYKEARAVTEKALDQTQKKYGRNSPQYAEFLANLGALYRAQAMELKEKGWKLTR